jgi:hemerythrin-like domain-containing protein
MADPITVWHGEHVSFARLLDLLEKQVAIVQTGRQPKYALMREIVYYLRHFPDRFHHAREDVAFACLVAHDPGLELSINRVLQEHRVIAMAGEELLKYLNDVDSKASLMARAKLEAAAATYLVYYRDHLAKEEKEILPRAAQLLTQEDWAAVAAAVPAHPDPLFGDDFEARYQELRRQIAIEAGEP